MVAFPIFRQSERLQGSDDIWLGDAGFFAEKEEIMAAPNAHEQVLG